MTDYMKEAKRLAQAYADAVLLGDGNDEALAALLAHIQRGVPEGWQMVQIDPTPEMLDAAEKVDWGDEDMRGSCCNQWHAMLAAAPDHFRDAPAEVALQRGMARDNDALDEARAEHACSMGVGCGTSGACYAAANGQPELCQREQITSPAPAGVPMPKPVAYGFGNTAITGHTNRLMMVRIDIPGGDQYAGAFWLPLVLADEAHTYGVACRAAGEAAGYARGLRDAVRDADIEALRLYVRALCKAVDAATDFAGTVAGGTSWWDDVWAAHAAALDRARERISQAALRGEVRP